MNVWSCLRIALATGALAVATVANAADYSPPPPPPAPYAPPLKKSSCHYFRADVGGAIYERPRVSADLTVNFAGFAVGTTEAINEYISDQAFVEGGWGCQFTETFRAEVTGGWRLRESVRDPYNTLDVSLQSYTGFVSFFYDITNYAGWTPFLGAGIGAVYHQVDGVRAPVDTEVGDAVSFAWRLEAGVSYDLTRNFKVDFSYRFSDYGRAAATGPTRMQIRDIIAHEFKLGLRWHVRDW